MLQEQEKICEKKKMIGFFLLLGLIIFIFAFPGTIFILLSLFIFLYNKHKTSSLSDVTDFFGMTECLGGKDYVNNLVKNIQNLSEDPKYKKKRELESKMLIEKKIEKTVFETKKVYKEEKVEEKKTENKSESNVFSGRSIWDNYESVLDKFKK